MIARMMPTIVLYSILAGDYLDCCAAEAIAQYFIRGIAVSTSSERGHNNKLCRDLNLIVSKFDTRREGESLFGDVGQAISVGDGIYNYTLTLEDDVVNYHPLHPLPKFDDIECIPNLLKFKQLGRLCNFSVHPERLKELCVVFLNVIIFSILQCFGSRTNNLTTSITAHMTLAYAYDRRRVVSVYEFCEALFSIERQD